MTTSTLPAPCRACEYAVWSESLCPCDAAGCPHAARPVGLHAAAVPDPLVGGDLAPADWRPPWWQRPACALLLSRPVLGAIGVGMWCWDTWRRAWRESPGDAISWAIIVACLTYIGGHVWRALA